MDPFNFSQLLNTLVMFEKKNISIAELVNIQLLLSWYVILFYSQFSRASFCCRLFVLGAFARLSMKVLSLRVHQA